MAFYSNSWFSHNREFLRLRRYLRILPWIVHQIIVNIQNIVSLISVVDETILNQFFEEFMNRRLSRELNRLVSQPINVFEKCCPSSGSERFHTIAHLIEYNAEREDIALASVIATAIGHLRSLIAGRSHICLQCGLIPLRHSKITDFDSALFEQHIFRFEISMHNI